MAYENIAEKLLFKSKERILIPGLEDIETNTYGRTGIVSINNPSNKAKYNLAAKALENILEGKVRASKITGGSLFYGEIKEDDENVSFYVIPNSKDKTVHVSFYSDKKKAEDMDEKLILTPLTVLCMSGNIGGEFKDPTKKTSFVQKMLKSAQAGEDISDEDVLVFCDAFYYDFAKDWKYEVEIDSISKISKSSKAPNLPVNSELNKLAKFEFANIEEDETNRVVNDETVEIRINNSEEDLWERTKAGEFVIQYEWDDAVKANIKPLKELEDFVPSSEFFSIMLKIKKHLEACLLRMDAGYTGLEAIKNDYVNFTLTGRPGTGKTTLLNAVSAALGIPVFPIPITKNTEEDTFQGMTKVVNGTLGFVETDFLKAFQHGGIIILEEQNMGDPAVMMGALGQAIERPFIVLKNGYEAVYRHPLCVCTGTMNIGTYGAKGVNQAYSSRFKQTYRLEDPSEEDFINILVSQGYDRKACKWVHMVYSKIIDYMTNTLHDEDAALNVTLRGCLGALENMYEGEDPRDAIRNSLIGKISETDLALAAQVDKACVENASDPPKFRF